MSKTYSESMRSLRDVCIGKEKINNFLKIFLKIFFKATK